MARAAPRINFNSSTFIRLLSALAVAEVEVSRQPFAERLGLWLDWTAAIPLSAALHAAAPALDAASAKPAARAAGAAAATALARVRAEVAHAIATDALLTSAAPGTRQARSTAGADVHNTTDFLPYRRCYQAHQRQMQARIAPLRAQVRDTLAGQTAALGKLAALDGVLDQALAARERSLLATVPSLLSARFERLQRAHLAAQAQPPEPDDPDQALQYRTQTGDWLTLACREMQNVLLAEMNIRLQPVQGLVEALTDGVATQT